MGPVKPPIVFFREDMPDDFHVKRQSIYKADLVIIMGTSLAVQPFNKMVT